MDAVMKGMDTGALMEQLQAAVVYFQDSNSDESEKQVILERATAAMLMIQSSGEITAEDIGFSQFRTATDIANNLLLVKIAETGRGWYGEAVV